MKKHCPNDVNDATNFIMENGYHLKEGHNGDEPPSWI
jgi:hypothetical protein